MNIKLHATRLGFGGLFVGLVAGLALAVYFVWNHLMNVYGKQAVEEGLVVLVFSIMLLVIIYYFGWLVEDMRTLKD